MRCNRGARGRRSHPGGSTGGGSPLAAWGGTARSSPARPGPGCDGDQGWRTDRTGRGVEARGRSRDMRLPHSDPSTPDLVSPDPPSCTWGTRMTRPSHDGRHGGCKPQTGSASSSTPEGTPVPRNVNWTRGRRTPRAGPRGSASLGRHWASRNPRRGTPVRMVVWSLPHDWPTSARRSAPSTAPASVGTTFLAPWWPSGQMVSLDRSVSTHRRTVAFGEGNFAEMVGVFSGFPPYHRISRRTGA